MDPLIISIAPNGARKTKKDHPALPLTPQEIAATAKGCWQEGASLIHLHIRDKQGRHTLNTDTYRAAIDAIQDEVGDGLIIQVTTESVGIYTPEEQMHLIRHLKPEAASFALRELIPTPDDENAASGFFHEVTAAGLLAQYILYSPAELVYFAQLKKRGMLPEGNSFVLYVLGKKQASATHPDSFAQPDDLDVFLESMADHLKLNETHWAICAFGGHENACMVKAAECGGHVRIGFENNHLLPDGRPAKDNADLIRLFCANNTTGRTIANADTARKYLRAVSGGIPADS